MLPSGGMGNGRIFTANTMGGSAAYWHLQRSGYLPWLVGVIVILSASWWGYSRGAGTTLDEISGGATFTKRSQRMYCSGMLPHGQQRRA